MAVSADDDSKQNWDELTDSFIEGIDDTSFKDSSVKLRQILTDQIQYASRSNARALLDKAKNATNSYFLNVLNAFSSEKKALDSELESMSVNYAKFSATIKEKTELLKVPYIKPYLIEMKDTNKEDILLESYDSSTESLLGKLIAASKYVADISGTYNGHSLGSWIFSSDRAYIVTIKPPENVVMDIESSKASILSQLDEFSEQIHLFETTVPTQ